MTLQPAPHFESAPYLFNARELARLAIYRAAIHARFYTDQCDQPRGIRHATADTARPPSTISQPQQRAA